MRVHSLSRLFMTACSPWNAFPNIDNFTSRDKATRQGQEGTTLVSGRTELLLMVSTAADTVVKETGGSKYQRVQFIPPDQ